MRKYWLFISMVVLWGCDDQLPTAREFPIVRTLAPTDNNETGATFEAEVLQTGAAGISSHGFIWAIADSTGQPADSLVVGAAIGRGKFSIRNNNSLARGASYYVRAFVKVQNKTIYGNTIVFKSIGSTNNYWSYALRASLKGRYGTYGSSAQELGHVLFGSSDAYHYDPEQNIFTSAASFPGSGINQEVFKSINSGKNRYFISSINSNLYSYSDGKWSKKNTTPFKLYSKYSYLYHYFQGYAGNEKLYFFSTANSYVYDLKTGVWGEKSEIPSYNGYSIAGVSNETNTYVIMSDKSIWEYTESDDEWLQKTIYPGSLEGDFVSFAFGDKIYFGTISRDTSAATNWRSNEFWSYNLVSDEWESFVPFPGHARSGYLFSFPIDGKLFIGLSRPQYDADPIYDLWQFDASKVEK